MGRKKEVQPIHFDPDGNCPICHNPFKGDHCPHTHDYVNSVVREANRRMANDFEGDMQRVMRGRKHYER